MACNCGGGVVSSPFSLPSVEYNTKDILTSVAIIGGMMAVAYLAVSSGEKKRKATTAEKKLRRQLGW